MQIVHSSQPGSRNIEHLGSAHAEAQPEALKAALAQRLTQGQGALDLGLSASASGGPASLVLFDVSTLYSETDQGDSFREPGLSKERRLEPQITIGLLTDASGFPLMVEAFEGNNHVFYYQYKADRSPRPASLSSLLCKCGC